MVRDANLAHLLATRETAGKLADTMHQVTLVDGGAEGLATWTDTDPPGTAKSSDLMYVIYTSGLTGKPKGVMVSHANVTRLFPATSDYLSFGPTDVWSQVHAYSFGFSVWEIWGPLLYGGAWPYCQTIRSNRRKCCLLRFAGKVSQIAGC